MGFSRARFRRADRLGRRMRTRRRFVKWSWLRDSRSPRTLPDDRAIRMEIPADLAPICPDDGRMMTTNLRVDARFVQDAGWYAASRRYELFLEKRRMAKTLYWELGIGYNTQETGLLHTKMDKRQDMVISQKRLDTLRWRSGASRLPRCRAEERRCAA